MDAREEIAMLRNECSDWRIAHARVESRLMNAEALLYEAADFVSDIKVGVSTKRRDVMVNKLRGFMAPNALAQGREPLAGEAPPGATGSAAD